MGTSLTPDFWRLFAVLLAVSATLTFVLSTVLDALYEQDPDQRPWRQQVHPAGSGRCAASSRRDSRAFLQVEVEGAGHDVLLGDLGARDLGAEAARRCLDDAGLGPQEVDHLLFVSTTGLAAPRVNNRIRRVGPDIVAITGSMGKTTTFCGAAAASGPFRVNAST